MPGRVDRRGQPGPRDATTIVESTPSDHRVIGRLGGAILNVRCAAHSLGGAEQSDDLFGHLARGWSNIDDQWVLLGPGFIERIDLAQQQVRGHEVSRAPSESFSAESATSEQIDKPNLGPVSDDHIAVAPLQGGAGDDAGQYPRTLTVYPGGHGFEPGLAVGIGERDAGMHLRDVGFGMQRITLLERPADERQAPWLRCFCLTRTHP